MPTAGIGARVFYLAMVNTDAASSVVWPTNCAWAGGTEVEVTVGAATYSVDIFPVLYGIRSETTPYMLEPIKDLK
jgi:hypothetical protein